MPARVPVNVYVSMPARNTSLSMYMSVCLPVTHPCQCVCQYACPCIGMLAFQIWKS
jgi:hypothetical protein